MEIFSKLSLHYLYEKWTYQDISSQESTSGTPKQCLIEALTNDLHAPFMVKDFYGSIDHQQQATGWWENNIVSMIENIAHQKWEIITITPLNHKNIIQAI